MAVVDALVRLKADTAQFEKAMRESAEATKRIGTSADKTAGVLTNKLKVAFTVATTAAAAFAVKLGRDSVQAAQTAAAAQTRLRKLLLNTNGATEEQIQVLFRQGQALESLTGITAENITVIQSQLATFDLHGSTIGTLTPAILDYVVAERGAAAGADEFRMMTTGLAQALIGNFGALTKQGFVLDATTKKMIASGTESERAAAIVDVLGFTYRDFAKTALTPAQRAQADFTRTVGDAQKALGFALIPIIGEVAGVLSKTLGPTLVEIQKKLEDGEAVQRFVVFIKDLGKNVLDFARSVVTVFEPIFTGLIVPAIKLAIGAVIGFIKVLGAIGRFIQNNAGAFQVLVGAIIAVSAAMAAYIIQVKVVNAVHKTFILVAAAKGKALKMLVRGFKTLNLIMKLNPIGLIIGLVIGLGLAFKLAWQKSETFRKLVIGAIQGVLSAVSGGLRFLGKLPGALGEKFSGYADSVDKFSKSVDNLNKKEIKGPKVAKPADTALDLSSLGRSDKVTISDTQAKKIAAEAKKVSDAARRLAEMKRNLEEAITKYNEYLSTDFVKSFENGADSARSAVATALDNLNAVFEAKGKMLSGSALASLRSAFDKVKKNVLVMSEQLAVVAGQIESVAKDLEDATSELEDALKDRAEAMKKFGELLRTPFGEPSQIDRAMRDAEATVDSVIGMYDQLVETVNQRFAGMESGARSLIVDFLTDQTAALVKLVKRRSAAIDALESAEKDLRDVLESQARFQQQLTGGIKDFAKALITLSDADTKAVLTVTRTASGLVISQVKKATTGVGTITKQLTDRLKQVVSFSKNIETLLAAGLNREYIQQLLEAGPSAAGETAQLLTTASAGQIAQINSLYTQINAQATSFGKNMSDIFYGNSVSMAQAFVKGAADEATSINAQITTIVTGIKTIMSVLGNTGLTSAQLLIDGLLAGFGEVNKTLVGTAALGINESVTRALDSLKSLGASLATDLAQGLFDKLTTEKARLVAIATDIATSIAAAMAGAAASIGVVVDGASDSINNLITATKAAASAASAASGSGATGGSGDGGKEKKTDKPLVGMAQPSSLVNPNAHLASLKALTPIMPKLSTVVGTTATAKMPTITLRAPTPVMPKPTFMSNRGTPVNRQGVPQVKPNVTVNITAPKVAATLTATTLANTMARLVNTRR